MPEQPPVLLNKPNLQGRVDKNILTEMCDTRCHFYKENITTLLLLRVAQPLEFRGQVLFQAAPGSFERFFLNKSNQHFKTVFYVYSDDQ